MKDNIDEVLPHEQLLGSWASIAYSERATGIESDLRCPIVSVSLTGRGSMYPARILDGSTYPEYPVTGLREEGWCENCVPLKQESLAA